MKYFYNYSNKFCNLFITEENNFISHVKFSFSESFKNFEKRETKLIKEAANQIDEYLNKKRKVFDLPLCAHGTEFQKKVWEALKTIPYGLTHNYEQISIMIGNPKACRAVGLANNKNPIAIIVPCHRVIGKNGSLVGYAGGLELKHKLLELEK